MLSRPSVEEEKTLRVYLGDARYERMHALALRRNVRRAMDRPRGNVVVIPGIMGSELNTVDRRAARRPAAGRGGAGGGAEARRRESVLADPVVGGGRPPPRAGAGAPGRGGG